MNIAASCEPVLEPNASEFIKRHNGEAAFQRVCELLRGCFPELASIHVRLLEDPDEDDHTWVVLNVLIPASYPTELLQAQEKRYYEELTQQAQIPYHPFSFSLMVDAIRD
jgi:hypothetical protein